MFNSVSEKEEEAEAWLSGMKKYFQIYNYSNELKVKIVISNLTGKADIWWQDIKTVKGIKEQYITWKTFKIILNKSTFQNGTMKRRLRNSTS